MPKGILIAVAVACFTCAYVDRRNVSRSTAIASMGIVLLAMALAGTGG
jgi:hypothetical protein